MKWPCLTEKTGLPLGVPRLLRRGLAGWVAGRWHEDVLAKGLKQGGGEVWVDASGMGVILCRQRRKNRGWRHKLQGLQQSSAVIDTHKQLQPVISVPWRERQILSLLSVVHGSTQVDDMRMIIIRIL